ncbi:MAG TPA: hypothetical protein VFS75_00245 [Candidatus Paceibacterota bacterium]|nr:hypothetical protein [Candidatus Paceibacterota bacterium]
MSRDILLSALIVGVSVASFALGRLSAGQRTVPRPVLETAAVPDALATDTQREEAAVEGGYVASKTGTKYHLPWCPGASQIKESNKIWFTTKEEAEAAGYAPAANCKGI